MLLCCTGQDALLHWAGCSEADLGRWAGCSAAPGRMRCCTGHLTWSSTRAGQVGSTRVKTSWRIG